MTPILPVTLFNVGVVDVDVDTVALLLLLIDDLLTIDISMAPFDCESNACSAVRIERKFVYKTKP
jgi:hypothetical protein